MKKAFCLLMLAAVCWTFPASGAKHAADLYDMGQMTCKDFIIATTSSDAATVGMIILWLDGFGSARSGNYKINLQGLQSDVQDLIKHCSENPKDKVIDLY